MTQRLFSIFILIGFVTAASWSQDNRDALQLYREGAFAEAVAVCLEELEQRGSDESKLRMDSYSVLGWSLIRLGDYNQALQYARAARQEVRFDVRIIEIEAEAQFYLGNNLDALALFEEYVALSPTGDRIATVYYFMGEIFLRLAEFRHADIAFATALHHSPQVARWWARMGYAKEQVPDRSGAAAAYERALELQPSLDEARVGLQRMNQG